MNIKDELTKRLKQEDDTYQLLGAELKQHRLKQSKTLSNIADTNFSISYLCKIERNQVKPSKKYLKEICEKIDISDDKVSSLLQSRDILLNTIKFFYDNNINEQNKILEKLEGLDNHRIILIRLICALSRKDYTNSEICVNKLWNIASSLSTLDLVVFTTFYGIYKYLIKDYLEASDSLKAALEFNLEIDYLKALQYGYLFVISFYTLSRSITIYSSKLELLKFEYGENLNLNKVYYYLFLYYLIIKQYQNAESIMFKIGDEILRYNSKILFNLVTNKEEINIDISKLNNITKLYYDIRNNILSIEELSKADLNTFSKLYLKYLYYKDLNKLKAYDFILDTFLPYIEKYKVSYIGLYLLNEILESPLKNNKYKQYCNIYMNLLKIEDEVNII